MLVTIQNMVPCLYKKFYYCYNLYFLTLSLTALVCLSLHKANIHVDNVYICDSLQQNVPWVVLHLCLIHKHKGRELNSATHNFGLTTCGRPQLKLYCYYCYHGIVLRPVCGAGRRKLRPNLAPMPKPINNQYFKRMITCVILVFLPLWLIFHF